MSTFQSSCDHREGQIIAAKYALEALLGQGGMGSVWIARNLALDVHVALKLVRPGLETTEVADRLLDEARFAAKLEHPGIVRVFDFGMTEDGAPFIVMELLDGQSFGELVRQHGRVSAVAAVQILLPILDALVAAHAMGVVHRDLTPDNIFIAREARRVQPKIVDFGIALHQRFPAARVPLDGTIVGTPRYMSPEQARGTKGIDHRSDLWTLCAVLYEAASGRPAFEGDDYTAVLRSVTESPVASFQDVGVADAGLWRIVEKGLAKDRAQRWQSAGTLGRALAQWLSRQGVREDITGAPLGEIWLSEVPSRIRDEIFADVLPLVRRRGGKGRIRRLSDSSRGHSASLRTSSAPRELHVPAAVSRTAGDTVRLGPPRDARGPIVGIAVTVASAILLSAVLGLRGDRERRAAARTDPTPAGSIERPAPAPGVSSDGLDLGRIPVTTDTAVQPAASTPSKEPASKEPVVQPAMTPRFVRTSERSVARSPRPLPPRGDWRAVSRKNARSGPSSPSLVSKEESLDLKEPY